jgi:tRNA threonylcarbamoyladenosine biosynthesis protein TsaB
MTRILHIETATKVCSVALSENGTLIGLKEIEEDGYAHGEQLTVLIQDLLKEQDVSMKELDAVSVSSGPGSYTGLRIGASAAKGICYAMKIPLIAIDALTSLSAIAAKKYDQNICAVIDARRMEVYNLISDTSLIPLKEITADIITEESYAEFDPFVVCGDGAEKLQEIWKERNCAFDLEIKSSAAGQIEIAFNKFNEGQTEDLAYWEPFYLKDFIVGKKK